MLFCSNVDDSRAVFINQLSDTHILKASCYIYMYFNDYSNFALTASSEQISQL